MLNIGAFAEPPYHRIKRTVVGGANGSRTTELKCVDAAPDGVLPGDVHDGGQLVVGLGDGPVGRSPGAHVGLHAFLHNALQVGGGARRARHRLRLLAHHARAVGASERQRQQHHHLEKQNTTTLVAMRTKKQSGLGLGVSGKGVGVENAIVSMKLSKRDSLFFQRSNEHTNTHKHTSTHATGHVHETSQIWGHGSWGRG